MAFSKKRRHWHSQMSGNEEKLLPASLLNKGQREATQQKGDNKRTLGTYGRKRLQEGKL